MAEAKVFGFQCKLYYKTTSGGTYAPLNQIIDATLNLGYDEAEATTRGSAGVKETEPALLAVSIEGSLQWRNGNAECSALLTAFMARAPIYLLALTGEKTDPDAKGVEGIFKLINFPQKQELANMVNHDVTFKPCAGSGLVAAAGVAP